MRPDRFQKQDNRARRPRLSVVAAQLAAARDEGGAMGRASRLGVALTPKERELAIARREAAAVRRENAALKSSLQLRAPGSRPPGRDSSKSLISNCPAV